jgi:hypothetical protein
MFHLRAIVPKLYKAVLYYVFSDFILLHNSLREEAQGPVKVVEIKIESSLFTCEKSLTIN